MKRNWTRIWQRYSSTPGTIRLNERSMAVFQDLIDKEDERAFSLNASFEQIVEYITQNYNLSPNQLKCKNSRQNYLRGRHVLVYLAVKSGYYLKYIGTELGGRNHATIINSKKRVEKFLNSNKPIRPFIEKDRQIIKNFLI